MNALEAGYSTVSSPVPVHPPQNGRAWALLISPPMGGASPLYQDPVMLDHVMSIILKYNGITDVAHASV